MAILFVLGCRTHPYVNAHIESVNAEYRQLEDYVYALEDENARLQQEVDGLRTVTVPSATPVGPLSPSRGGIFRRSPAATPRRQPGTDTARTPGRSTLQWPDSPPAETPPSFDSPARRLQNTNSSGDDILPIPAAPQGRASPKPEAISPKPADKKITHLFLNPLHTGGANFDGQPGDDGVRVVVEPRNAGDQFVAEAGPISVVVLDPTREGEAARVARWDFDQSAARQLLAASSPDRGIKLEMPWPASAPDVTRLKLFVRYETADGRRLQADREIFITPPGQAISRWTPRSAERPALADATVPATEPVVKTASALERERPEWSPNR
jgi:hypothetical protein